jgi:hypothetical protein
MQRSVIAFGLISAGAAVTILVVNAVRLGAADYRSEDILGYLSMALSALLVFAGIRSGRAALKRAGEHRFTFSRGFVAGLGITLISALCYVVAFQVMYFKVMPDLGTKYVACMVARARDNSGGDARKVDEAVRSAQNFKELYDRPAVNAAMSFAEVFPIGLVASAISAALLRTRKKAAASAVA